MKVLPHAGQQGTVGTTSVCLLSRSTYSESTGPDSHCRRLREIKNIYLACEETAVAPEFHFKQVFVRANRHMVHCFG